MNKCYYCEHTFGIPVTNSSTPLKKTRDHIIPASKDGNSSQLNIVYACRQCNHLKGNKLPEDFSQFIIWKIEGSKIGIRSSNCFSVRRLEVVLNNNKILIEKIKPYRDKLLKSAHFIPVSKNKPTVKQRKKIKASPYLFSETVKIEEWTAKYDAQPHCSFHY